MTDDLTRPGNLQLAQASGEGNTNQDIVAVTQPPNGGETILPSLANRVYDLRFDPRLAQVRRCLNWITRVLLCRIAGQRQAEAGDKDSDKSLKACWRNC